MVRTQLSDAYSTSAKYNHAILEEIDQVNAIGVDAGRCELRYLWRAVIAQSLIDALNHSKKLSSRIERARAIAWFSPKNKDFLTVCSYADLEPSYVLDKVRKALQLHSDTVVR